MPSARTRTAPEPAPARPARPTRPAGRLAAGLVATLVLCLAVVVTAKGDGGHTRRLPVSTTVVLPTGTGLFGGSAVPADVEVSGASELRDGSEVTMRVTAKGGSEIYGFEAFLCAAGTTFELDADVRPDDTGNCVSKPLSAGTERYRQVKGSPPYQVVEAKFRVGVGTDTYLMTDGTAVTITCGPGYPCQLVLKIQYPNGFGFRPFALDYA